MGFRLGAVVNKDTANRIDSTSDNELRPDKLSAFKRLDVKLDHRTASTDSEIGNISTNYKVYYLCYVYPCPI